MRRHFRHPFEGPLQISWKDPGGKLKTLAAKCADLSAEGACLETNAPIPPRTNIAMHSVRYGTLGSASVRHCVRHTLKYSIGVEFTSALAVAVPGRKRLFEAAQPPPPAQS